MSTRDEIEGLAAGLSEAQRECLLSIHPDFGVGEMWRPDEGESHNAYAAMARMGLLNRHRFGDFPTFYSLTPLGLAVRNHLASQVDHAR